jgi:microcystin-dependent protein
MGQSYIGEIRMFGGNFAPVGWAFCDGQQMQISENDALYNLIGTAYGGNGTTTFNLPDLRGRLPIHQGLSYVIGQIGGTESVTLTLQQIPSHNHTVAAKTSATATSPSGAVYGGNAADAIYSAKAPSAPMNAGMVGVGGGSQPHDNMMPYLAVSFIISLFGVYPSQ